MTQKVSEAVEGKVSRNYSRTPSATPGFPASRPDVLVELVSCSLLTTRLTRRVSVLFKGAFGMFILNTQSSQTRILEYRIGSKLIN